MTIDDAIKHCEEVADGFTEQGKCAECAAEHRQLAEWLKELKQLKEQEFCEDAINRQAVLERLKREEKILYTPTGMNYLIRVIEEMPSVKPQYTDAEIQKMQEMQQAEIEKAYELGKAEQLEIGHWIDNHNNTISCNHCHTWFNKDDRYGYMYYCPNCRAKMREVEE